jgi:integrase
VPHGLRKAFSRRLAEADVSVTDIAACTGHRTLRDVQRYTEKFDRKRGASRAMAKLQAALNSITPAASARHD